MGELPPEIFKAYAILGIVGVTLTAEFVGLIGRAVASEARAQGYGDIVLGRDGRLSGPALSQALAEGIREGGGNVIDLGLVTTPMAYFAAHQLGGACAVMLTGSHNPPEYNGLKVVIADSALSGEAIQGLRRRIERADFGDATDRGAYRQYDIAPEYLARIVGDVKLARPMKVLLDAGNGVAGAYAPALFRALGCEVEALFCEVDGRFPNHHPDPSIPENLADLASRLCSGDAEIGLAFDGDGDRLGVVTKNGGILYPDRQLMLFAADVLERNPGALILYDVKSSRNLHPWIVEHGGRPMIWKSGHSLMKAKMRETGALLAGELSGHVFFQERWYGFDDGLYAGARLLEILSRQADFDACLHALPDTLNTPELQIKMREGEPQALMVRLLATADFSEAREVITLDGLRVEYADGFGLMRASNTTPVLMLRFEADDSAALRRIQERFRHLLLAAAPAVQLPF